MAHASLWNGNKQDGAVARQPTASPHSRLSARYVVT